MDHHFSREADVQRALGRIEGDMRALNASVAALSETMNQGFEALEKDILELKLERARAQGRWSAIAGAGAAVGALVGGIIQFLLG